MTSKRTRIHDAPRFLWVAVLATLTACSPPLPTPPEWEPVPFPAEDEIDHVLFLIGDAGEALPGQSPVMARMAREIEAWSARLARDSAVSVAFLGDIVYPDGVRTGTPYFPADSARLQSHVDVLSGPAALRHSTVGLILAGNHDWGQMDGPEGIERLRQLDDLLEVLADESGARMELLPAAGDPGPHVLDLGDRVRLLSLDTHWWLQARGDALEDSVVKAVGDALETAGGRDVVLLSHHPFWSGGAHGGPMPIWEGLGILWLLRQSGTLVQDLNSTPYRRLRLGLGALFAEIRRPLMWAGGHDHSLQVLRGRGANAPEWNVVSGSGSKLTDVVQVEGLLYGEDAPGFMTVVFRRDGGVLLHVYAGPDDVLHCKGEGPAVDECMERGVPAFEIDFALRLR